MSAVISTTPAATPFAGRAYWREAGREIAADWVFYGLVLGYAAVAAGLALSVGAPQKLVYLQYAPIWLRSALSIALAAFVIAELPASIRANPQEPLARLKARLPLVLHPRVAAGLLMVLGFILVEGTFTSVKNVLPDLNSFHWDGRLADADKLLAGGKDPWLWLQPVLGHHLVTRAIQMLYTGGWLAALCTITGAVAISRRMKPLRLRFALTYLICWIVLGNVLAGIFLSGGPVYYGHLTGDVARFAAQIDYLSFSKGAMHSSFDIQNDLWSIYESKQVELGSGISAFPSLHIAMVTLFALTCWNVNRWAGIAATVFGAIIFVGSVHLAWHYAIDGYVSLVVTLAVWFGIAGLQTLFSQAKRVKSTA